MNVTLFLTRRCNLACDYCYESQTGGTMSAETLEKAVRFSTFDGRPVVSVVFFGGEPLLEKGLIEHGITFCRKHEKESKTFFHLKISTNGVLLDEETVELFQGAGMLVSLSFDGCRSAHDAHRKLVGGQGTFEIVDRAAGLLMEKLPHSTVVSVVTPHNVGDLYESVEFLFGKGFRYVIAELDYTAAWDVDSMKVLEKQYRRMAKLYIERMGKGDDFYLSVFDEKISSHVSGGYRKNERCEMGHHNVAIAPDGTIYPCIEFVGMGEEWAIGHVDTGIEEGARDRIYEESEGEKEPCTDCAIKTRCRNWCGCMNMRTTGTLTKISPVLCAHERMVTPIADEIGNRLYKRRNRTFLDKFYNAAYPFLCLFKEQKRS
ncbi:MAG: radical SAM protein [Deltaproteobacteria bacterium]|nr:radical SAM protein [Deltaproteobacteria bacterium]